MSAEFLSGVLGAAGKIGGAFMDRSTANAKIRSDAALAQQNIQLQKEFATKGIQWKVDDAKSAGVHPLFALGASTQSFSPVSVGAGSSGGMAEALGGAGQDIGRAVNATMSSTDRKSAAGKAAEALSLERGQLENDLLRTQLASQAAKLGQAGGTPPMPSMRKRQIEGQGSTDEIGEDKKYKDRPKMMMGGRRVLTDPTTSNMESTEDRYGDEGPVNWAMQLGTAWNDFKHNVQQGNLTRQDVINWVGRQLKWIDKNTGSSEIGSGVSKLFGRR